MVNIKNKQKVIVNIHNVQKKRRPHNGLKLSQERIVKHYHFNSPSFTPIQQTISRPVSQPVIDTEKEKEREKELTELRNELKMRKMMSENHANVVQKLRDKIDPREELSTNRNETEIRPIRPIRHNLRIEEDDIPATPATQSTSANNQRLTRNGKPDKRFKL
jgi:hypothetical protein